MGERAYQTSCKLAPSGFCHFQNFKHQNTILSENSFFLRRGGSAPSPCSLPSPPPTKPSASNLCPQNSSEIHFMPMVITVIICILMNQEMLGWQWHQLDHMQIICTSIQTDNHASTSPLNFLQAICSSWRPANSVKALTANTMQYDLV